ncbi:AGE family epimerase/isomerase [Candidatus Phycosocius spiralis]|uniref:AGE family epimerase/isomerase n=1 Tax=Candidatus Phycosocius spiralis TaxID=2815099 RepID=A0ABQ4PV00_9PROT|nr:AGE family epimerase/isomerase [Candidatus Phycosocius spiralis]GIU66824.1 AGE family epimerase/isomerase [Candidatus Phycosocius spiralis]
MFEKHVTQVRNWMFDQALPLWGDVGIDRVHGGYTERLKADGTPDDPGFKRIRVIGRQIYVFSHAFCLGWKPGLALAEHGFHFLVKHAWLGEVGGWARRVTTDGQLMDPTPDLYDNAFALFALAWFHRASGRQDVLSWALKTVEFIEAHMRHPNGIGFMHEKPAVGPRQQNPHMHLLEAALAWLDTQPHPRFETLARKVVTLFETKLFDQANGRLPEYFDEDMVPLNNSSGRITEPGHQLEWAWILGNANRLLAIDTRATTRALIMSAEANGVDPISFATYNQVRNDGLVLDKGSRTWPNTERIKAHIAAYEIFGTDPRGAIGQSLDLLFSNHLNTHLQGTWVDAYDSDWNPCQGPIPTSTLYHVFLAFAEILRVSQLLESNA